jgi:hypothetical protein
MAPITFTVLTITNKKFEITIDDTATVHDLAVEISKKADIPLENIQLKMRGARNTLDKVQDKLLKDVEYLRERRVNSRNSDILLLISSGPPKFKVKEQIENIPCGGKRKKTRKSKTSRKQTRRRR